MARSFARSISLADASGVQSFIDVDAFGWTIANGAPGVKVKLDENVARVLATMGARFASQMPGGTRALFRGLVERHGETRALVRLLMGEANSLNYIELRLGKRADGRIVIFDWFDYYQGRSAAAGMRDPLAMSIESLLEAEYGFEQDDLTRPNVAAMQQLIFEALNGNFTLCLEAFAKLPRNVQIKRGVLLSRHRAAMNAGSKEALQASLSDLASNYGDAPELQLIINDYWFMQSDRDAALASLNMLLERLLGDAPLHEMVTIVYRGEGELEKARKSALAAVANDPDFVNAYWSLLEIDAEREDYAAVKRWLNALRDRFGVDLDPAELADVPLFSGFADSPEFAEWSRSVTPATRANPAEPKASGATE